MLPKRIFSLALILSAAVYSFSFATPALAQFGYGGGLQEITVCQATGSRFLPFVKLTVPMQVGDQILSHGGVLPDSHGNCPAGESISQFISDLLKNIFHIFA